MKRNVGNWDRVFRGLAALVMLTSAVMAPLPLVVRVVAFGAMGVYMMFTALAGTCLGYRMMGRSTCPIETAR